MSSGASQSSSPGSSEPALKKAKKTEEEGDSTDNDNVRHDVQEWVFGIESRPISSWNREPPLFQERIRATNEHTFFDVIEELCHKALPKRREHDDDYGVYDHLWNLTINSPDYKPMSSVERIMSALAGSSSSSSTTTEPEKALYVAHPHEQEVEADDDTVRHISAARTKLSADFLPVGHVGKFQYDYGSTTVLYLKILSQRTVTVDQRENDEDEDNENKKSSAHFGYFVETGDQASNEKDLCGVAAYGLAGSEQLDAFYPNFSRACLGEGVPLYESQKASAHMSGKLKTGKFTMGLSSKTTSELDKTFCSIEDSNNDVDLMYCPDSMDGNLSTLFATCEEAWTPRKSRSLQDDPDALHHYRYNWISRFILDRNNQEGIENTREFAKNEFGPKVLIFTSPESVPSDEKFDFSKHFPRTTAHLTSGKFRWFSYDNHVLRVIVGRAGPDRSIKDADQVLKTWNHEFRSLHELFCAVEASWITESGEPLEATTFLEEYDADLGPSRPTTPSLAKSSDAVVLSSPNSVKKLVTALSLAKDETGDLVVYCGHDDGTLDKWHLESGKRLFCKQIYTDAIKDFTSSDERSLHVFTIKQTGGVAGLIVDDSTPSNHVLYTWTHTYSGYPDVEWDDRGSSKVHAWSGKDGKFLRRYDCDVGDDEEGDPAHPSIGCVVRCRLLSSNGVWRNSVVVGLHCIYPYSLYWKGDYSTFHLDWEQEVGQGNILPFDESSGEPMETWRGHNGMVQALGVIPDKYLFSFSIQPGHGFADAMILWDLKRPGVPLNRLNLWDPRADLFRQDLTRVHEVVGISIHDNHVMLASEYGKQVAVVALEDESGEPKIRICGYGVVYPGETCDNFQGCMAMSGNVAAMTYNEDRKTWLFNIDEMESHPKLDRRDGGVFGFQDDDDEEDPFGAGRRLARGVVSWPKPSSRGMIGDDGPLALAMRGKCLAAGYANGTILYSMLPDEFENEADATTGSAQNGLTSCSWLPSDEWDKPVLCHDDANREIWSPFAMRAFR